jgi:hypothetical protein
VPVDASLILAAAWLGWHFIERRAGPETAGPATRIGAAAGLVALLVHMTVDFDLYEMGTGLAFFVALALVTMLHGGAAEVRLPRAVCAAASAILLVIVFPLLALVTPRALAADGEVEQAQRALHELGAGARKGRSPAQLVDEALRLARAAQSHNPFLADAYRLQAEAEGRAWKHMASGASMGDAALLLLRERDDRDRPRGREQHRREPDEEQRRRDVAAQPRPSAQRLLHQRQARVAQRVPPAAALRQDIPEQQRRNGEEEPQAGGPEELHRP